MTHQRIPRQPGERLVLNGVSCRLTGNTVIQGDTIAYSALAPGFGLWEDVMIRELYPFSRDGGISRGENGALHCTAAGARLLGQKRKLFLRGHQVEQEQFKRLPPHLGAQSFCCEAYGTSYTVRIFPRSATFEALLKQNPDGLLPEEAVSLILKLLDALEAIHNRGLLHLEIIPSRIYLLNDNTLILDHIHLWERGGELPDTPWYDLSYAAPELRIHNRNEMGPATDLYAVAALFYHLIYGQKRLQSFPQSNAPNTPLAALFRKGLHILPRKRFATAAEFRSALLLLNQSEHCLQADSPQNPLFEKKRSENQAAILPRP